MKIRLITVGRTNDRLLAPAIERYVDRVSHYNAFEIKTLPDVKNARSLTVDQQRQLEGRRLLEAIDNSDHVILLDERGDMPDSRSLAKRLEHMMLTLRGTLVFVIGGPYGFAPEVYARANSLLALSRMTLTHEMVRLFFVEQLYRAMTIIRGESYHH